MKNCYIALMKKLTGIITVLFGLSAAAVGSVSYHDSYEKVDSLIKSNKWEQLISNDLMAELRLLSSDDRFRIASALKKNGVFNRTLYFDAKHKVGKVKQLIESGQLSEKELALHKLGLFLISDTE